MLTSLVPCSARIRWAVVIRAWRVWARLRSKRLAGLGAPAFEAVGGLGGGLIGHALILSAASSELMRGSVGGRR
jgi:hypothetical protein